MLKSLSLRDFVIVDSLEVEFQTGFTVLTGETGAGKSILIDALQLVLGERGDAAVVREGCGRADIAAVFERPASLAAWMQEHGFDSDDGTAATTTDPASPADLLLRRTVDKTGKSRAWINGGSATVSQLREVAEHLVDIHGQHAWQGLTRAPAVRDLLDDLAGSDIATLQAAVDAWRAATGALEKATQQRADLEQQREQLAWELKAIDALAPQPGEWAELTAQQQRLAHAQSLIDACQAALSLVDDDGGADALTRRAVSALDAVVAHDATLAPVADELRSAQVQLHDAARSLASYLTRTDVDPASLAQIDARLADWLSAARRHRCPPADLPSWREAAHARLAALQASADTAALMAAAAQARDAAVRSARQVTQARQRVAPALGKTVTEALQTLGMPGASFEVALPAQAELQRYGAESVEFLVAGHAGATPRPLAKVASGGELSRIALAIAVATRASRPQNPTAGTGHAGEPMTVVFDEVDSGIGGSVGDTVGRLLKRLGRSRQVLAVTHLAQVAACADHHHVVSKGTSDGRTLSRMALVEGETRVQEIARMLGGEHLSGAGRAHAADMLAAAVAVVTAENGESFDIKPSRPGAARRKRG